MLNETRRSLLRGRTQQAHDALDRQVGSFESMDGYRIYLSGMAAFRVPLERRVVLSQFSDSLADHLPPLLTDLLLADLEDLGVASPIVPATGKPIAKQATLGTLYVLHGSALGARVLYRRAQQLGLTDAFGARHLARQCVDIEEWRSFLAVLESAEPFDLEVTVESALATFRDAETAFADAAHAGR